MKELTPREAQVFALMASGLSRREAARKLGIKYKTADVHAQNLYQKLGVHSQRELIVKYGKNGGKRQ